LVDSGCPNDLIEFPYLNSIDLTQKQRREFLSEFVALETTFQLHFPGHFYIGPGTHVIHNVINGILPYSYNDAVALIHDINYLMYAGEDVSLVDFEAINSFDKTTPAGIAGIIGLSLKQYLPFEINSPLPTKTNLETKEIGMILHDYVANDDKFQNQFVNHKLQKFLPINKVEYQKITELKKKTNLTTRQENHLNVMNSIIENQKFLSPDKQDL
jgi:hypothetical protein